MFSIASEGGVGLDEEVRIGELFEAIERRRLINGSEGVFSIVERLWCVCLDAQVVRLITWTRFER